MNFWHWLTTSRYTRRLEDENRELKGRIAKYEAILWPKLFGTMERLRNSDASDNATPSKTGERPNPSLGPVKRRSWQETRAKLERLSDPEPKQEERLRKVVNAHKSL